MPSQLDLDLERAFERHYAPGGLLETAQFRVARFGVDMPLLVQAPPALPQYLAHFSAANAEKEFIVDGPLRLTFAEAYAAAREAAGGLVAGHGVRKGDFVGIAARNSGCWIVAYMAVIMAGGCATLLNGWWQGSELAEGIRLGPCKLVLADAGRAKRLEGLDHGATILPLLHDCPPAQGLAALTAKGGGADTALPEVGPDDRATMLFTSGSTGQSKGAWSDHRGVTQGTMNYLAQSIAVLGLMEERGELPSSQPTALVNVPLFHVTGEVPLLLQSYALGRKLVLMPKWDATEAMRLIEAEKITYFVGVPLMSYEIATHPDKDKYDLSTCVTFAAGGAPRPAEHVSRLREALPHSFPILGYGLTETNGVGAGNFNENYLAKPGSTGRASPPLAELGILDDDGKMLPQETIGEVCIRSICNFVGYWNNPEATAAAFTADGWFRSGDLGYLDEDAYLFIVDRKKDIIIRGGENISSIEVETALYAHPDVAEASVFGLPDERFGEVPVAVYQAEEGRTLDPEALRAFVAGEIAPFKVPAKFWQVTEPLPRLGTEKVDKRALRTRYAAEWKG
ncbi:class I adenylate-forming enzyme family protein [Novosphingobium sp. Gsoil 351]|uniref:class I adenylate-forming enzyme family protein n=1 Tax=Novosphingobium sp. Gsoil 351 TaxID=2675225 RepID=UPI0012B4BBBD|nr:class I adenylate-forming enzyme family protein [Novosphingobium sp. Gsoil 351]QGN54858.1 AMP-binding protein [Novosphingobium sp. Gsoil 351]